jgi:hypothetical protein
MGSPTAFLPATKGPSEVTLGSAAHTASLSDGSDDYFSIFARGTIIGSQVEARFLRLDPSQYQKPSAPGARRPSIIDELIIQRVRPKIKLVWHRSSGALFGEIASQFLRANWVLQKSLAR